MRALSAQSLLSIRTLGLPAAAGLILLLLTKVPVRRRRRIARPISLASLRNALIGHGKRQVLSMLGSPRVLAHGRGETWYYPLHDQQRLAMAICFDHEQVGDVEFFNAPQAGL